MFKSEVQQLVIQYQAVSPENVHTSNAVQTDQVTYTYLGVGGVEGKK